MRASIALMNDHPLALGQEDEVRCGAFSERLGPLHGHELVTAAGFGDVAGRWERRVVEFRRLRLRCSGRRLPRPGWVRTRPRRCCATAMPGCGGCNARRCRMPRSCWIGGTPLSA